MSPIDKLDELEKVEFPLRTVADDSGWSVVLDAKGMTVGQIDTECANKIEAELAALRRRAEQADALALAAEEVAKLEIAKVSPVMQALAAALAAYREQG